MKIQWRKIFKVLKGKKENLNLGFYIQQKIFFENKGGIYTFSDKQKGQNSRLAHPHENVRYLLSKRKIISNEYLYKEIKSSGSVNFIGKYVIYFYTFKCL